MSIPDPRLVTRDELWRELEALQGEELDPEVGLYGPDSAFWALGRHSLAFLGAARAALLQLAHPWVANAIDQHSRTRSDPLGRFRGTFRFVLTMAYGTLDQAMEAALSVHEIHARVRGELVEVAGSHPRGERYEANQIDAMVWVQATLWETSVMLYELILGPLDETFKERYYQESKRFARLFGIPREALPADWPAFVAYNRAMWDSPVLGVGEVGRELGDFLFRVHPLLAPLLRRYRLFTAMLMPARLREGFALPPDTPDNRRRYERMLWLLRQSWPHLPRRLRYLPVYLEAQRRLRGKRGPDPVTAVMNRLMVGRYRLVS
ncbi:MAG TPA: oxygenase MpaB family protein [Gammaproteobacteria bacterium]|nr:oxygenase MpaB family protein [Gammaproteobacteria bacterium]